MRIAIVGNATTPHVIRWADAFERRGHVVGIFGPHVPTDDPRFRPVGRQGAMGPPGFLLRLWDLRRALRSFKPDIVHGHFAVNYGTWAVLAGGAPTVVSAWGSDLFVGPYKSRLQGWKVRTALRRADAVTANSPELADAAISFGAASDKVHLIVFGVDTDRFKPAHNSTGSALPRLLSTRQLKPIYRVHDLIDAAAEISHDFELDIASTGPELEKLTSRVTAAGLEDRVRFLGWVDDDDLPELYRRADIYVTVSESDSMSVSLLEAMATGLPAVATDIPANRPWVGVAGEGGYLVPVGDTTAIAQAVDQLLADEALRRKMGVRNRDLACTRGDWNREVDKMLDLYGVLLQRRPQS